MAPAGTGGIANPEMVHINGSTGDGQSSAVYIKLTRTTAVTDIPANIQGAAIKVVCAFSTGAKSEVEAGCNRIGPAGLGKDARALIAYVFATSRKALTAGEGVAPAGA